MSRNRKLFKKEDNSMEQTTEIIEQEQTPGKIRAFIKKHKMKVIGAGALVLAATGGFVTGRLTAGNDDDDLDQADDDSFDDVEIVDNED